LPKFALDKATFKYQEDMEYNVNATNATQVPPPIQGNGSGYQQPMNEQRQVSFGEAIKRGFKNYCNFTGRASRSEFWWWELFVLLVMIVPVVIYYVGLVSTVVEATYPHLGERIINVEESAYSEFENDESAYTDEDYYYNDYDYEDDKSESLSNPLALISSSAVTLSGLLLIILFSLVLMLPTLGLVWRRLHDIGKSGAWYFILLIPFVNIVFNIVMIVWYCQPSEPYDNQYGEVPNTGA